MTRIDVSGICKPLKRKVHKADMEKNVGARRESREQNA